MYRLKRAPKLEKEPPASCFHSPRLSLESTYIFPGLGCPHQPRQVPSTQLNLGLISWNIMCFFCSRIVFCCDIDSTKILQICQIFDKDPIHSTEARQIVDKYSVNIQQRCDNNLTYSIAFVQIFDKDSTDLWQILDKDSARICHRSDKHSTKIRPIFDKEKTPMRFHISFGHLVVPICVSEVPPAVRPLASAGRPPAAARPASVRSPGPMGQF